MTWRLEWSERARKETEALDPQVRRRILAALERLAIHNQGDVLQLTDVDPPQWRLRVGAWRIRFRRDPAQHVIYILHVLPRDKAYR